MLQRDINHQRACDLLDWYDAHGRELAWRKKGGTKPDPYHVWLSEIMLQQTTVQAVTPYFAKFLAAFPTICDLAHADDARVMEMWAGLGYYARARNLLKCARAVVSEHGGTFPTDVEGLKQLPGIGDYTAAAIASIAFNSPAAVVDGNVERVMTRLYAMREELSKIKAEIKAHVAAMVPQARPGDFAQATMDLGATVCTPKSPKCLICPWREGCAAHALGRQLEFPVKPPKKAKPKRFGTAYWLQVAGDVYLIRRPDKGLLGGMLSLPSTEWLEGKAGPSAAPIAGEWRPLKDTVRHIFTHFELQLSVAVLHCVTKPALTCGEWRVADKALLDALPTVMKKAAKLALTH
ncbi:MAG: A/G-specific adenine glycosylase [Pseudomonadota bacterium]